MSAWTKVSKPTTDDWTGITKPSESSVLQLGGNAGEPIGLLLALTYAGYISSVTGGWGNIIKPTSSIWTLVAKPTT